MSLDRYRKSQCRYCAGKLPEPFLDLGATPLANSFLTKEETFKDEFSCPLRLSWCPNCNLVQLADVVPADLMFANYLYVSSTTQTFRKHFGDYAVSVRSKLLKKQGNFLAVDIGSNDGLLLSCYQNEGMKAVGVEPAKNLAADANARGLSTVNEYFGETAVSKILKEWGPADVISGNNVFAHIDDIHSVLRNVNQLLHPQGIFVIEFPYLAVMVEEMLFDMIYHEHLSYIGVLALENVLKRFCLEIFHIDRVASHGGSLRVFIQKKDAGYSRTAEVERLIAKEEKDGYDKPALYEAFAKRVYQVKEKLVRFVTEAKAGGKSISGYGAPAKGNTLINSCRFNANQIDYIVDDNPLKQNLYSPGAKIPVVPSRHLFEHPTKTVIIFAWNFAEEILKKLEPLRQKGVQFIIPLPEPRIV